jgi:serine/threonine protein kinase/tetratricopeptide (TPR) repeat protein
MADVRWDKLKEAVNSTIELDPALREKYLTKISTDDISLRLEVTRLLDADRYTAAFLEEPCVAILGVQEQDPLASAFQPGEMVSGRFTIVRLLGTGGMGQVYEALDTELGVHIALKTVRAEISQNPAILEQFRQEVRLARRITHANVCRIFDIQRERLHTGSGEAVHDVTYLTMEYLEGETLQQRLRHVSTLSSEQTCGIAWQIAQGLRAAHLTGVIHRDMKPANVMLIPTSGEERAVITDFGLARFAAPTESQHSGTLSKLGGVIGTPAYMAPEQLQGGAVFAATDIYAFGLLVLEMLTGSTNPVEPFLRAENVPGTLQLSPTWRAALAHCLQLRPQDRFASAQELVAFLESSPSASLRATKSSGKGVYRFAWYAIPALLLLCVALFLAASRLSKGNSDSRIAPGATVVFTGIRNATNDKYLDNLSGLMQQQLKQTAHFNLLSQDRLHDTLQAMTKPTDTPVEGTVAREVAMRTGAARVVSGTVSSGKDGYTLAITVEQPDNTPARARQTWQKQWSWQSSASTHSAAIPTDLLRVVRDSSDWVRHEVGESADDIARLDAPPEDVTTGDWDALAEYTNAESLKSRGQLQPAIAAFRNAVSIDPHFALAYGRLGDSLANVNQYQAAYTAYAQALEADQDTRLTRRERDRIRGSYAIDTGDYAAAEAAFADMSSFYEHDYLGWFYRAYPLLMMGRFDEAMHMLEKANEVAPNNQYVLGHLARFSYTTGKAAEAQKWIAALHAAGFNDDANYIEGLGAFSAGDLDHAARNFEAMGSSTNPRYRSWRYSMLARVAAERGYYSQAIGYLNDGIKLDLETGDVEEHASKSLDRAYMHCALAEYDACLNDYAQSLQTEPTPQRLRWSATLLSEFANATNATTRAQFLAELTSLRRMLPAGDQGPFYSFINVQVQGETLLAHRDIPGALKAFDAADKLDSPITPRDYLGRALLADARTAPPSQRKDLQQKAANAFYRIAGHPGVIGDYPQSYPPGIISLQQACYLNASHAIGEENNQQMQIANDFKRRHSNNASPEQNALATSICSAN